MSRLLCLNSTGTTYSDDSGTNWKTSTSLGSVSEYCYVNNGPGNVVLVFLTGTSTTTYRYSNDAGITWSSKTLPITGLVRSCVWVSAISKFVFSWDNGSTQTTTWSSSDGITWTSASISAGYWTIATDGTTVVATDPFNNTAASGNGTSWTNRTGASGSGFYSTWVGGTTYVSISHSGTSSTRTINGGLTWTAGGTTPATSGSTRIVSNNAGTVIANLFGQTGKITRSTDGGTTWSSAITVSAGAIGGITYFDGRFYIVTGNQNYASADGLTWTTITSNILSARAVMGIVNPNWAIDKAVSCAVFRDEKFTTYSTRNALAASQCFTKRNMTMSWNTLSASFGAIVKKWNFNLVSAATTGIASFIKNIRYSRTMMAVTAPTAWRHKQFAITKALKVNVAATPTLNIGFIQFVTGLANSVTTGIGVIIKTFKLLKSFPLIAKARSVVYAYLKMADTSKDHKAVTTSASSCVINKRYSIVLNTTSTATASGNEFKFTPQTFKKLV